MIPSPIESALLIADSMMLMPCGHPDALWEVQRQMRLVNDAYGDPMVLRLTDNVVQAAARLHGRPSEDTEEVRRGRGRGAIVKLWTCLELLQAPSPRRWPVRKPARARSSVW